MASRFDYVRYDACAQGHQERFKQVVTELEAEVEQRLAPGRARSLAITKLEEVYMWIGKQIRDDQIVRNGSAPLQEERGDE